MNIFQPTDKILRLWLCIGRFGHNFATYFNVYEYIRGVIRSESPEIHWQLSANVNKSNVPNWRPALNAYNSHLLL